MIIKLIGILTTLLVFTILIINNSTPMTIKFLSFKANIPVIVVVLSSILVGVILSVPAYLKISSETKKKIKYLTDRIKELEEELNRKKTNEKK